jgi:beta-aspartyl-peptidase (threonine type)
MVDNTFFTTPFRVAQLEAARAMRSVKRDHDVGEEASAPIDEETKRGTVGAVCLDASGGLAAATSTGGLTNKVVGRVGDTPVLGAGTWADARVAVSGTGTGEAFLRRATAKDIAARVAYGGVSIAVAAEAAVGELLSAGGDGGVIAVDSSGRGCMVFNSEGMYRGSVRAADASPLVSIYRSHAAEPSGVYVD